MRSMRFSTISEKSLAERVERKEEKNVEVCLDLEAKIGYPAPPFRPIEIYTDGKETEVIQSMHRRNVNYNYCTKISIFTLQLLVMPVLKLGGNLTISATWGWGR